MTKVAFKEQGIQEWIEANPIQENMRYRGYAEVQLLFVRDRLTGLLLNDISYDSREQILRVISTHTSRSITLPVYKFNLKSLFGLDIILRDNFHDWKVSIDSLYPIPCNFMNLFDEQKEIDPSSCEGFPKEYIFGSFKKNSRQFTIEISDHYKLHTFMWILNDYIKTVS